MQLQYRIDQGTSLPAGFPVITAREIYSPQIGFATNAAAPGGVIPVIQFVSGNGTNYEIWQISQKSATTWSAPQRVSPPGGNAVFLHMVADIRNNRPDIIWFDHTGSSVHYLSVPDLIAPW